MGRGAGIFFICFKGWWGLIASIYRVGIALAILGFIVFLVQLRHGLNHDLLFLIFDISLSFLLVVDLFHFLRHRTRGILLFFKLQFLLLGGEFCDVQQLPFGVLTQLFALAWNVKRRSEGHCHHIKLRVKLRLNTIIAVMEFLL